MTTLLNKKYEVIILDRDGVINKDSAEFIKSPREWEALPGSVEAITKLSRAGYKVVVVTNQSGIARGYFTLDELEAIHEKMRREIEAIGGKIDGIFICPHGPDDQCACRKPKSGLLIEVARQYGCGFAKMLLIGDSMRDILAAQACGCDAFLVKTGKGMATLASRSKALENVPVFDDLAAAVEYLLDHEQRK
jgi:D-glycero-D-manno-heptose 1,7-bisphosphate phosphatase